jgi:starvation-inducible DNA-binding protein
MATQAKSATAGGNADVADHLVQVLEQTYTLLIKTHVCHWNVVGPTFLSVHNLTEEHYTNLFEATDTIAERVRALGRPAGLRLGDLDGAASADAVAAARPVDVVKSLADEHEALVATLREAGRTATDADDLASADLVTERLAFHEKAIWMLRAMAA